MRTLSAARKYPVIASFLAIAAMAVAVLSVTVGAKARAQGDEPQYLSPREMKFSPDGQTLYIVCEHSNELLAVDAATGKITNRVSVGRVPKDLAVAGDGRTIYVTNSWDDTVSIVDAPSFKVTGTLPTGYEPGGVVVDASNRMLYVANRLSDDISVIDLQSGQEVKRLMAGRGASYLALSPDGTRLYCTHIYPRITGKRTPPESEITVVDTARQVVVERIPLHNVAGVFHVTTSKDGKLGVAAQLRPKNLVPLAHVEHGWVFGNSLVLLGEDVGGKTVQVPLDELDRYYTMPYDIAIAPDKSKLYVSTGGAASVTVISIPKLLDFARTAPPNVANDLSASSNYVIERIPVGVNPRGLALSADGKKLYVANRLDDNLSVIDTNSDMVVSLLDLGGRKDYDAVRRGERLFYTASFSFQDHFSCANCHIDSTFDGLQWDLEPDGFGKDIVDNRLLEDLSGTEPFKWNGGNPDMATECGPRTEKFFYRSQSNNAAQLADLVTYVMAMPLRPNRYRLPGGELTPAQERGKVIFLRTKYKNGRPIPQENQCAYCHSGPKYTNQKLTNVGSGKPTDRSPMVDVPQLTDVAYTAPYLHDGSARSLEEIWTVFNPNDTHGVTNDLTKDELNDLIEYLRTL